jgi:hypothetical protein
MMMMMMMMIMFRENLPVPTSRVEKSKIEDLFLGCIDP